MARKTQAQRQAEKAARRAFRQNKKDQRRSAKTERQAQRQQTRIAKQEQKTSRVESRTSRGIGKVAERQAGRTGRTEFRQDPLNVAQRQQTLRGAFEGVEALGGNVLDFLGSSQEVSAFNENPEAFASAFGIGSGVTPSPEMLDFAAAPEQEGGIMDTILSPVGLVGIAAVGGAAYYFATR